MNTRRYRRLGLSTSALLFAMGLLLATGCTQDPRNIELKHVSPPTGGAVKSLTMLHTPSEVDGEESADENPPTLVAPAGSSLFVRPIGSGAWSEQKVTWPESVENTGQQPIRGLSRGGDDFSFSTRQLVTSHRGRVWMLTRPTPGTAPKLLVSDAEAANWSSAPLPNPYEGTDDSLNSSPGELTSIGADSPLRIVSRGSGGLYLMDSHRIWKANFEEGELAETPWEPISMSGINLRHLETGQTLPAVVRNYLPANETRRFELLTVFREHLYVYRRLADQERWVLVATLPTVDRDLYGIEGRETVYLVSPDAVFRSSETGEKWTRLSLVEPLASSPTSSAFLALSPPESDETDESGGSEDAGDAEPERQSPATSTGPVGAPTSTLLVGTEQGSIYRSTDGGDSWETAREPDPDNRGITGLVAAGAGDEDKVWASTAGQGVLVSSDGGQTWAPRNRGLRASRPLELTVAANGELLMGTNSGLYRLSGAAEAGRWNRFHQRATSALYVDPDNSRIFSGTLGGAVVTQLPGGDLNVSEAAFPTGHQAPFFQPADLPAYSFPESAILSIQARPGRQEMFAWSRRQGVLLSNDGGTSWRRTELNEALLSALERAVVTNFQPDHGERMYVTSHPLESYGPVQLWQSYNDGDSWHAVYSFQNSTSARPVLLRRTLEDPDETLFVAHGDRFARTTNGGNTWVDFEGPWEEGAVVAYSIDGGQHTLVVNTRHASELVLAEEVEQNEVETERLTLDWPGDNLPKSDINGVERFERFLYLTTSSGIYAGTIPRGRDQLPHGTTIILMVFITFAVTGLAFGYLKLGS